VALRNSRDVTVKPLGVSDAQDGTNAAPGAMTTLQNLVPAYHTENVFAPRPAAVKTVDLSSINAVGVISCFVVIDSHVYGMISSSTYPGYDQPFVYNLGTGVLQTVTGVAAGLLPTTQPTTGDWVPPTIQAVTPTTLVITHPGFPGSSGPYFGWLDISSFVSSAMVANTTLGSNVLTGVVTTVGSSAPILQGVQPGQAISGTGIPAGAYVVSATNGTFTLSTTGSTHSNTTLDALGSTTGVIPGTLVTGPNIPPGAYVTVVNSSTSVTISQAATATGTGLAVIFSGQGTITISANATSSNSVIALTVTGGTPASPRWGAGNTNTNPLTTVPTCAYGFNARCYFGSGPYLVYSDSLNAIQVSLASQAITVGDSTNITALSGVPLTSQLTGGVQQSMTVFKGAGFLYQVTGDPATANLLLNAVAGSVGTLAPRTIVGTPVGTAFMAVDGLRILGLSGTLSEPIGVGGTGVAVPFLNAVYPTRMCAGFAENIYRITVTNGATAGNPTSEYWFDVNKKVWTGPHTFPCTAVQPYSSGGTFLVVPTAAAASIWRSDAIPNYNSVYIENGAQLTCSYQTALLPDSGHLSYNRVNKMTLSMSLSSSASANVTVTDDNGYSLATTSFNGEGPLPTLWGYSTWGGGYWGSGVGALRQYALRFPNPLFFRQAYVSVTFSATSSLNIGNLYAQLQPLGYFANPNY